VGHVANMDNDVHVLSPIITQLIAWIIGIFPLLRQATQAEIRHFAEMHIPQDKVGCVMDIRRPYDTVWRTQKHRDVYKGHSPLKFTLANGFMRELASVFTRWFQARFTQSTSHTSQSRKLVLKYPNGDIFKCYGTKWVMSGRRNPYALVAMWSDEVVCEMAPELRDLTLTLGQKMFRMFRYREATEEEVDAYIAETLERIETETGHRPRYWNVRDLMILRNTGHGVIVRQSENYPHMWYVNDPIEPTTEFYGSSAGRVMRTIMSVASQRTLHVDRVKVTRYDGAVVYEDDINIYPQLFSNRTRLVMVTFERHSTEDELEVDHSTV